MRCTIPMRIRGVVLVLAILGIEGVAQADFLITLRSGKKIKVSRYQEEGNQIAYRRFGGKIAIPKKLVATLENLETGEKRVFNRSLSAQELEALRDAQAANLRKLERKQEIRDSALREHAPQIESPVAKEKKGRVVTEKTPRFDFGRCMATGEGAVFGLGWERMTRSKRVRECESGERGIEFRRRYRERAREKARREKALYDEALRERERVDRAKRLLEKAGQ